MKVKNKRKEPISINEDIKFQMELADEDDLKALERAEAADRRVQANK